MEALAIQFVLMVCGGVYPAIQPMGTTCGEASSAEEEDSQTTKQTPTEEDDQSTIKALAIQFVLMVCGGVHPAIQPMGTTCGEASSPQEYEEYGQIHQKTRNADEEEKVGNHRRPLTVRDMDLKLKGRCLGTFRLCHKLLKIYKILLTLAWELSQESPF